MAKQELTGKLKDMVIKGEDTEIKSATEKALSKGIDPLTLIDALSSGLKEVGEMFSRFELFLSDMMLSAESFSIAMEVIKPKLTPEGLSKSHVGKVVIGTAEGDQHDIGKNLVSTMLQAAGFEVFDIGVDAHAKKFIEKAEEVEANVIAISALMSSTMTYQKDVISLLDARGKREKYKVVVGGGPVTAEFAEEIKADGYAKDAAGAVEMIKKILNIN